LTHISETEALVTESVSGFLAPEEREALELRREGSEREPGASISHAILQTLSIDGPTALPDLLLKVHARAREVFSTVDDLDKSRLVRLSDRGDQEVVELTEEGRRKISSGS
jgi:hypothetical protein